ncbi:Transposon Tf2-11 polyprotein [Dictyocoela muelleri]|nr:Transposon Tf2-11 polyprotein [Dictyocoela muelleri]
MRNASLRVDFLVVEKLPVDAIFGNTFLKMNKAIICLESHSIFLSGMNISFNTSKTNYVTKNSLYHIKKEKIIKIIMVNNSDKVLGTYTSAKHKIQLTSEPTIKIKQYSVPFSIREIAKEYLDDLISKKIIMKSESKYCSCAYFLPKKDKTLRLVVDYSNINKHTAKEVFPFPNLHKCHTELSSSKICVL